MAPKKSKTKKKNWIAGAIKKPGALSKTLGVPEEENIPMSAIKKAEKSKNKKTRKRAHLAETLKKVSRKRKKK